MIEKLEELYLQTQELVSRISIADEQDFTALIQLRDEVLGELREQFPLTESDLQILKYIDGQNSVLLQRMMELRDQAAMSLGNIRTSRLRKQVYDSEHIGKSYFIDRKR